MAIGVRFPEGGSSPVEVIGRVVAQATGEYAKALDARLRLLLDANIAMDRISIVTFAACPECRGLGNVVEQTLSDASHMLKISECPACPGICVDGKSIRNSPTR